MYKTNASKIEPSKRLTVTLSELPDLLGCGRETANQIAIEAEARVYRGKRILINIKKIQQYLDRESI